MRSLQANLAIYLFAGVVAGLYPLREPVGLMAVLAAGVALGVMIGRVL
jgi:hypothetical protein